jgi:aldehyde dehydrogenase (NAD+)
MRFSIGRQFECQIGEKNVHEINSAFNAQRQYFESNLTKSLAWRLDQLTRLETLLRENETSLYAALASDFKKAAFEQHMEVHGPLATIANVKANLTKWIEPEEVEIPSGLTIEGHKGLVTFEPYGVTLVISPFNAPLILLFEPVIAALSAGNTVIAKPSDATVHTCSLLMELIPRYFAPEVFSAFAGGKETVTELLGLPFDFIAFTGSTSVGKVVMRAAAENLTPVLLELGGQNCAVVDETANIENAATQLTWGATAISGQWCVSPGYAFVHRSVADQFVESCKKTLTSMYGKDATKSPDYSRMSSAGDVLRVARMIEGTSIVYGGKYDADAGYFEPTLIYPVAPSDPVLETEVFGPVLPIIPYDDLSEVIRFARSKSKGLAGYIFSTNEANIKAFLDAVSFGGGCVNNTNIHCWLGGLPFGGVGHSGLGKYLGKQSFLTFSNKKSLLVSPSDSLIKSLYPPYTFEKMAELGKILS